MNPVKTLGQFIIDRQADFPYAKEELSILLRDIGIAAKNVNQAVNQAGLVDIIAEEGSINVQGERQNKLDVYANEQFISALQRGGECCMIVSEENKDALFLNTTSSDQAKYIVALDPLDGSSNIDVNVSVGTIFSIYRREVTGTFTGVDEFFQKGIHQVAAGYVIYGSSTMLIYTTGQGVNGFTLNSSLGEFCLSHPDIKIPDNGNIYSINEGNAEYFSKGIVSYIHYCKQRDLLTNRPYSLRYTGSMVADLHRTLIKGGIFIYPATEDNPCGKLRLLYECNPMAFIVEQAGGSASNGLVRILDIPIVAIHQRSPIFIGSAPMVSKAVEIHSTFKYHPEELDIFQ